MLQTKNLKGFYFFLLLIVSLAAIALLYTKSNLSLEPAKIIKPLPIKPPQSIVLRDKTLQWGLLTSHQQTSEMLTSIEQLIGGGICAFDFNNDGWQDLFIIGGSGEHRFYGRQTWWKNKVAQSNSLWLNNEGQSFVEFVICCGKSTEVKLKFFILDVFSPKKWTSLDFKKIWTPHMQRWIVGWRVV